jgi:Zn-dependent peptidase ImmA (M78 family)
MIAVQTRRELTAEATARALRRRNDSQIGLDAALAPFDIAERTGVDVLFSDIPSMEGVYVAGNEPHIILSSLRPAGRRAYTCAHELGHHEFDHGSRFDPLAERRDGSSFSDPVEFTADRYAEALLMPRSTVASGFRRRGWDPAQPNPTEVLVVSAWLGVGFATLVHHLHKTLGLITNSLARALLKNRPAAIRASIAGRECPGLFVVDRHWIRATVDCEVGDLIMFEGTVVDTRSIVLIGERDGRVLLRGEEPGTGSLTLLDGRSLPVRVQRREYVGRHEFAFDEEEEE